MVALIKVSLLTANTKLKQKLHLGVNDTTDVNFKDTVKLVFFNQVRNKAKTADRLLR